MKTDEAIQLNVVAKCEIFTESLSVYNAILDLISVYFAFNIAYPKPLYPLFLFVQHYVLLIKDSQPIPLSTTQLVSAMDKLS